jgi:hypothetical protein
MIREILSQLSLVMGSAVNAHKEFSLGCITLKISVHSATMDLWQTDLITEY